DLRRGCTCTTFGRASQRFGRAIDHAHITRTRRERPFAEQPSKRLSLSPAASEGPNGNQGGQSLLRATTQGFGMSELAGDARALKAERDARRFATDRLAGGVFVGREREVGELCATVEAAENGRGSLSLLCGEPGIAKTRLADRVADLAAGRGVLVLWGRAFEGEGAPAFWPWVQEIRGLVDAATPSELAVQLGAYAARVAHFVPDVRERLPSVP